MKDTPTQNIIEYLYYYNGGGVAIGDINNDGLLDVYFTANQNINRLYLNLGDFKFKDVTEKFNLPTEKDTAKWSTGVVMVDVNGDGYLDIYECVVGDYKSFKGSNKLYINQEGKSFTESAQEYGLDFSGFSTQSAFFDFDQDGDLDMYLLNHSIHGTDTYGTADLRLKKDLKSGDRFYENKLNENLGFVDVTDEVGIYSSRLGYGLGLAISDINGDNLMDIYIGNDFHEDDYIYLNNGDKTFTEASKNLVGHTSQFTMGLDVADINQDGKMDIFSLDMLPADATVLLKSGGDDNNFIKDIKRENGYSPQYSRNAMQINFGDHFKELAMYYDLYATDWSWSVLIQDFDNDADQDLYITNGIYKRPNDLDYINYLSNEIQRKSSTEELIDKMPSDKIDNVYFENIQDLNFNNTTKRSGLSNVGFSNGAAYGDLDNDGDLDLVVNNLNDFASVFKNTTNQSRSFLTVSLYDSSSSNKSAIGGKVTLFTDSLTIKKEINLTRGFQSSISSRLHFGLGVTDRIDSIEVVWPNSDRQIIKEVALDQFLVISKSEDLKSVTIVPKTNQTYDRIDFVHQEDDYQDYQVEKLLPWALSKEGPAIAVSDLNNDGLDDFYIGGAHFLPGKLFLSSHNGSYSSNEQLHFLRDAGYEDIDASFIDINSDGFLDLFVCSGGSRFSEGHPLLEDRIYLNNGRNQFNRWIVSLPKSNSSSVSFTSSDKANYLFVGGRSIPGEYGTIPNSYLLQWKNGSFNQIQFYDIGLVTDSEWVEYKNTLSLIVVGEWMPISLFQLEKDSLVSKTDILFEKSNGLWNSVAKGDLNNDGIEDYFFGNIGLNSKWKPSKEQPVVMYSGDFDANGQPEPIIFNSYYEEVIPFNPRMDLIKQVPPINKEINTNLKFSMVRSLEELISTDPEEVHYVYTSESTLLLSKNGGYEWKKLADEFQYGAIQDAILEKNRILYVGNDFSLYSILGRSDTNHGGIGALEKNGEIKWRKLDIPINLDYRKIKKVGTSTYLVVPNSERPIMTDIN